MSTSNNLNEQIHYSPSFQKKYMITVNKETIKKLKPYWKKVRLLREKYWSEIIKLENLASKKTKLPIEIFHCDNDAVGIGTVDRRMRLIFAKELEK
jgi:hypothetical protein